MDEGRAAGRGGRAGRACAASHDACRPGKAAARPARGGARPGRAHVRLGSMVRGDVLLALGVGMGVALAHHGAGAPFLFLVCSSPKRKSFLHSEKKGGTQTTTMKARPPGLPRPGTAPPPPPGRPRPRPLPPHVAVGGGVAPQPPIAPPLRDWPPELISSLEVEGEPVARGSFGEVFRGIDRATGATVAVKVLAKARPAGGKVRCRFFFFCENLRAPSSWARACSLAFDFLLPCPVFFGGTAAPRPTRARTV